MFYFWGRLFSRFLYAMWKEMSDIVAEEEAGGGARSSLGVPDPASSLGPPTWHFPPHLLGFVVVSSLHVHWTTSPSMTLPTRRSIGLSSTLMIKTDGTWSLLRYSYRHWLLICSPPQLVLPHLIGCCQLDGCHCTFMDQPWIQSLALILIGYLK